MRILTPLGNDLLPKIGRLPFRSPVFLVFVARLSFLPKNFLVLFLSEFFVFSPRKRANGCLPASLPTFLPNLATFFAIFL